MAHIKSTVSHQRRSLNNLFHILCSHQLRKEKQRESNQSTARVKHEHNRRSLQFYFYSFAVRRSRPIIVHSMGPINIGLTWTQFPVFKTIPHRMTIQSQGPVVHTSKNNHTLHKLQRLNVPFQHDMVYTPGCSEANPLRGSCAYTY